MNEASVAPCSCSPNIETCIVCGFENVRMYLQDVTVLRFDCAKDTERLEFSLDTSPFRLSTRDYC